MPIEIDDKQKTNSSRQKRMIELKNGSKLPEPIVNVVMTNLEKLYKEEVIAFCELVAKCRNQKHKMFADTQKIISKYKLSENGIIHSNTCDVVLSAVEGDGFNITLGMPMANKLQSHNEPDIEKLVSANKSYFSLTPVLFIGKMPSVLVDVKPYYRGDKRSFVEIHRKGITSRGLNTDLRAHALPPDGFFLEDSAYISTTTSKQVAAMFPLGEKKPSYVYEIHTKKTSINVVESLINVIAQNDLKYLGKNEQERAILYKIDPSEIKGSWRVLEHPTESIPVIEEQFVSNPKYIHPLYDEQRLWMIGKSIGYVSIGIGIALDSTRLYQEYQYSEKLNKYGNTYREITRITAGWSSAWAMGMFFSKIGAASCAPLSPLGSAVCGIFGGFAGSMIGYHGGGEVGRSAFERIENYFSFSINQPDIIYFSDQENLFKSKNKEPHEKKLQTLSFKASILPDFKLKAEGSFKEVDLFSFSNAINQQTQKPVTFQFNFSMNVKTSSDIEHITEPKFYSPGNQLPLFPIAKPTTKNKFLNDADDLFTQELNFRKY